MPLSNPFRRSTDAPSLRERAAALRASFRPSAPIAAALPAPGSDEAKAAWHAACHQHSIRTASLHDCPELMRTSQDVWSTDSLTDALEAGQIEVAEYARLHPLASERELRFAQIAHELNIGALFALAYAAEHPIPLKDNGRSTDELPAPGSPEAMSAYESAYRAETIQARGIVDGYPELKRGPSEWWITSDLCAAMAAGKITPAECARLYPIAAERELRLFEIRHDLNLGALHALAFADTYPLPAISSDPTSDDAELLRLGRLFEAARDREMAACEACNTATKEARNHMPERPAALRYRASDHALYLHKHYTSPEYLDGREITHDDVEWVSRKRHARDVRRPVRPEDKLPADAQFVVGQEPWPEAQARADEIVAAWKAWHAERDAVYAAHDLPRLEDVAGKAGDVTAALAERLAAIPAHTADGFRVKLRAFAFYRRDVLGAELEDEADPDQILSHSLWRDVQGELPEAPPAHEPNLVSLINLASATMQDLQALHDTAQSLGDAAGAFAWTARCHTKGWAGDNAPGDGHNAAGRLTQWLGDALSNVQHAANEEAKRRVPVNSDDREIRWQIIARPVLENDDPAEIASFARDLREYAKQQGAGEPTDPVLALIAESHRAEEAAADLEVNWRSIPLAERAGREEAMSNRQAKARDAAIKTMPTTHEGLKAFADFVGYQASLTYGSDWRAKIKQEMGGDLLVALCAAVETLPDA